MDLNLQRNDLLQTASTQRRTMRLLPPGTKKTQKVALRPRVRAEARGQTSAMKCLMLGRCWRRHGRDNLLRAEERGGRQLFQNTARASGCHVRITWRHRKQQGWTSLSSPGVLLEELRM